MSSLRAPVDRTHVRWSVLTMLQHDIPEMTAIFQRSGFRGLAAWLACGVVDIWDAFPYFSVVSAPSRISRLCRLIVRSSVAHPAARRARMAFCHVAARANFPPLDTPCECPSFQNTCTNAHAIAPAPAHKYPQASKCTNTHTHTHARSYAHADTHMPA